MLYEQEEPQTATPDKKPSVLRRGTYAFFSFVGHPVVFVVASLLVLEFVTSPLLMVMLSLILGICFGVRVAVAVVAAMVRNGELSHRS